MRHRVFLQTVFTILAGFFCTMAFAQPRPWMPPANVELSATGTGRTTGHIATLSIANHTNQPQQIDVGNLYIPSNGKYQSYVVPEIQNVEVPPLSSATVDVIGYCADVSRLPVGDGQPMPPVNTWLAPVSTIRPDGPPSFIVVPAAIQVVERKPGQTYIDNVPVGYVSTTPNQAIVVDADEHPEQAAAFLLDAISRITFTYDDLQPEGVINTPFSNSLPRERESVIQQTFWMYGAALTGDVYDKDQFAARLEDQYTNSTGTPIADAPPAEKERFEAGITDFWDSFSLVGVEAKVISTPASGTLQGNNDSAVGTDVNGPSARAAMPPTPKTSPQPRAVNEIEREIAQVRDMRRRANPNDQRYLDKQLEKLEQELKEARSADNPQGLGAAAVAEGASSAAKQTESTDEVPPTEDPPAATEESPTQDCECGYFSMKVRVKKPDGSYDRYFDVDYDPSDGDRIATTINATAANLAVDEEIEFELSDVSFECSCEQAAPCETYTPRRIYGNEPKRNAERGSFKIHTRDEMCETIKNNEDNTKVTAKPSITEEECNEMEIQRQYGFMVEQVCQTESCGAVSCFVYIFIRL